MEQRDDGFSYLRGQSPDKYLVGSLDRSRKCCWRSSTAKRRWQTHKASSQARVKINWTGQGNLLRKAIFQRSMLVKYSSPTSIRDRRREFSYTKVNILKWTAIIKRGLASVSVSVLLQGFVKVRCNGETSRHLSKKKKKKEERTPTAERTSLQKPKRSCRSRFRLLVLVWSFKKREMSCSRD